MLLYEKNAKLDPRVKRTRKLLQQAFAQLMSEKDFQSITVQDIAERAEVNRATFYAHFEDKYALLNYSVREALQDLLEQKLPDTSRFTLPNLRLLIITVSDFLNNFYGHCAPTMQKKNEYILIAAQVQLHLSELLLHWFQSVELQGTPPPALPEHAAATLSWTIFGTAFQSMRAEHKQTPEQLADQILSFLAPTLNIYLGDSVAG
jgi:AcrR family transcriptional regulator